MIKLIAKPEIKAKSTHVHGLCLTFSAFLHQGASGSDLQASRTPCSMNPTKKTAVLSPQAFTTELCPIRMSKTVVTSCRRL